MCGYRWKIIYHACRPYTAYTLPKTKTLYKNVKCKSNMRLHVNCTFSISFVCIILPTLFSQHLHIFCQMQKMLKFPCHKLKNYEIWHLKKFNGHNSNYFLLQFIVPLRTKSSDIIFAITKPK